MFTEQLTETLTEYELERDKPMPSKHHSIIQGNLSFLIRSKYGHSFRVLPEISLDLPIRDRVPDLAIYPPDGVRRGGNQDDRNSPLLGRNHIAYPEQH